MHKFNEDYYEDGVKKKLSGYTNYRWMPTRSISEAVEIKKRFAFKNCVDVGCAKGFLVHALRLLGCDAYGEDISEYAIKNCYPKAAPYLSFPNDKKYDLLICKDVPEHIDEEDLPKFLNCILNKAEQFFFVIPLGDNDSFRIREYEVDITHVTKKNEEWWIELFNRTGYKLKEFSYSFGTVKEKWTKPFPYGNGFFVLEKNNDSKRTL
jgi:SAM-dependent methyltransferase